MSISRREFIASSATVTLAAAVASGLPRIAYTAAASDPDVIVIGAGLSGLETALTLEENGVKVLMLEGRRRIGGRVYSLFNVPGHPEVGGNTIANAYGRMIAAGAKYGVEIVNIAPRLFKNPIPQELFLSGEHIALKDWPAHKKNPFVGAQRALPPWAWADALIKQNMPFKDLENWYDPKYAQYDISMHEFFTKLGASEEQIRLGFDTNIGYGTTSYDVSLLMQAFSDYWQAVNRGMLMAFSRTGAVSAPPATGAPPAMPLIGVFKGGNQNLPIAMAAKVKGPLLQGKRVVAIDAPMPTAVDAQTADRAGSRGEAGDLFETYRSAMQAAGQDTSSLSRAKLESVLAKQEAALRKQLGCAKVSFKVVVQDGKVKLKAAAG